MPRDNTVGDLLSDLYTHLDVFFMTGNCGSKPFTGRRCVYSFSGQKWLDQNIRQAGVRHRGHQVNELLLSEKELESDSRYSE